MACPLFLPATPLDDFSDLYAGTCAADTATSIAADTLRQCCNVGYARGVCERAGQSNSDAFRFAIKAKREGMVEVAWSSERNHHPVAVGTLAVDGTTAGGTTAGGEPLERQTYVYAMAYLRQTGA
jgi:hypothetical protein